MKFFPDLSHVRAVVPCRPDGHTFAVPNFHIKVSRIQTKGMVVQTVDLMMGTKELDMLIIHMGMELKLRKTLCHFLVAQLQDLEPNVSRKH
jgi:hypothetical protein